MNKEKKQLIRLTTAFGVLIFLIVALVVFSPLKNYALAYLNSYSKNAGDLVTAQMWNNLDDDFAQTGLAAAGRCRVVSGETWNQDMYLSCAADEVATNNSMKRRQGPENGCNITGYVGTLITDVRTVYFRQESTSCGIEARVICCK